MAAAAWLGVVAGCQRSRRSRRARLRHLRVLPAMDGLTRKSGYCRPRGFKGSRSRRSQRAFTLFAKCIQEG